MSDFGTFPRERQLSLGWAVTRDGEPKYWLHGGAKAGRHVTSDLVLIEPERIDRNTVIIGQSGSARPFFLGRYVEEIVLKTKCQLLILDLNSDFLNIGHARQPEAWEQAGYNREQRRGFLPDEASREDFDRLWRQAPMIVHTRRASRGEGREPLRPNWCDIPIEWLFDEIDLVLRHQLRCCHGIMKIILELMGAAEPPVRLTDFELLQSMKDLFAEISGKNSAVTVQIIKARLPTVRVDDDLLLQRAAIYNDFVVPEASNFYFNVAIGVLEKGHLGFSPILPVPLTYPRIRVIDLASISDPVLRTMTANLYLEREWQAGVMRRDAAIANSPDLDSRVPIFIVIDEAHNLASADARGPLQIRSQELLRAIVSDSDKLGVYLLLASQRPDKLDPLVVSECENRAIMKLGSPLVLQRTAELLGVDYHSVEKCLSFHRGNARLFGPWVQDEFQDLYSAARRTEEGSRALQRHYWTKPWVDGGG